VAGDFTGDGKTDLAHFRDSDGTWWVSKSTGTGFTTSLWADFSTTVGWGPQLVGDFTGDGTAAGRESRIAIATRERDLKAAEERLRGWTERLSAREGGVDGVRAANPGSVVISPTTQGGQSQGRPQRTMPVSVGSQVQALSRLGRSPDW
jgi:hypothetical protein